MENISKLDLSNEEQHYIDSKIKKLRIDSIINTKNFFLHDQNKLIRPSEKFRNFIFEKEYKLSSLNKDSLGANKAIDKLNINRLNESTKQIAAKEENTQGVMRYTNTMNEIKKNIPEQYQLKDTKDENLMVSLYRNQNHISFRKHKEVKPDFHPQWKLYRVISGHTGWVRCIDVDPTNNW